MVTRDVLNPNESVIMSENDEETKTLFESHSTKTPTSSSTLDLNSDIFWTQNELHGKFLRLLTLISYDNII
jgi:hypothetical protein